jgi:hypothetical protein
MAQTLTVMHSKKKKRIKKMRLAVPALLYEYGNRNSLLTFFLRVAINRKV